MKITVEIEARDIDEKDVLYALESYFPHMAVTVKSVASRKVIASNAKAVKAEIEHALRMMNDLFVENSE